MSFIRKLRVAATTTNSTANATQILSRPIKSKQATPKASVTNNNQHAPSVNQSCLTTAQQVRKLKLKNYQTPTLSHTQTHSNTLKMHHQKQPQLNLKMHFNSIGVALVALLATLSSTTQANQSQDGSLSSALMQPPVVQQFQLNPNVQENQRVSIQCLVSTGDAVTFQWFKDGVQLGAAIAAAKRIKIMTFNEFSSSIFFEKVRLDHAGNYTCLAKNRVGVATQSQLLIVHGEPRWFKEPPSEPIVATRGQTLVVDCTAIGYPKPIQSWKVKSHTQAEFEPLQATSRVYVATNGSLIIKNADKSDEANYLCTAANGVGRGLSASTSVRVTVPAHFESSKPQSSVVRKSATVQLRCDAYGDAPIAIDWFRNKQRLVLHGAAIAAASTTGIEALDARYSIHNTPLESSSGLISILNIKQTQRTDNALFECVARNPVGKDRLQIELFVQEEPDNIAEIQATQLSSRSATLVWTEPYDGRSPVLSYMFQYKRDEGSANGAGGAGGSSSSFSGLSASAGQSSSTADDWQQAARLLVPLNVTLVAGVQSPSRQLVLDKLEPSSKYVLRAIAINAVGQSRFSEPMEFTTDDEKPELAPVNVRATPLNSSALLISWDDLLSSVASPPSSSPQRANSFLAAANVRQRIHGYYIGYRELVNASAALTATHNFLYKTLFIGDDLPAASSLTNKDVQQQQQRLESVLGELKRDTMYEVTVVAFNARGSGPASASALARTVEMEAPKPVRLSVKRESNESIFIEWSRESSDQNPVDDYVLYQERSSASQEWLQVRLPGNQTQYKAPGLKCGTRYQFYIIAHNKVGKSPPSDVVGASTSGALPAPPSKMALIKMINSTCLGINLNAFQDNGCRIKSFAVRYRVEKASALTMASSTGSAASTSASASASASASITSASPSDMTLNGAASAQALTASEPIGSISSSSSSSPLPQSQQTNSGSSQNPTSSSQQPSEWISLRPRSKNSVGKQQKSAADDERIEYLCDLSASGEYTVHVAAANDVGRSEIEYTVLMSSDELRRSAMRDVMDLISAQAPTLLNFIQCFVVWLMGALCLCMLSMMMYTSAVRYYHKFTILHNQLRATRRANRDAKRRRSLTSSSAAVLQAHNSNVANSVKSHGLTLNGGVSVAVDDRWVDDYTADDADNNSSTASGCFDRHTNTTTTDNDIDTDNRSTGASSSNASISGGFNSSNFGQHNASSPPSKRYSKQRYSKHARSNSAGHLLTGNSVVNGCNGNGNGNHLNSNNANYLANASCGALDSASILTCDSRSCCYAAKCNSALAAAAAAAAANQQFAHLSSVQHCAKMNDYALMPTLAAVGAHSPQQAQNSIYGLLGPVVGQKAASPANSSSAASGSTSLAASKSQTKTRQQHVWYTPQTQAATILPPGAAIYAEQRAAAAAAAQAAAAAGSLYYSTLRSRPSMRTYRAAANQSQQPIYGYHYLPAAQPTASQQQQQQQQQQQLDPHSIYVPPVVSTSGLIGAQQQVLSKQLSAQLQQQPNQQQQQPQKSKSTVYSFI